MHIVFVAAVCSGEGPDEPAEVNILLSLSGCHKYHFQLLNVMEPVGVTTNIVECLGIFIPAAKVPSPCVFFKYQTKSCLYGAKELSINQRG